MSSAAERRHLARVASLPCFICGAMPCEVHHIRSGQGMRQRASHFLTMPLCPEHHRGKTGIHGDRSAWKLKSVNEMDGLADTYAKVAR